MSHRLPLRSISSVTHDTVQLTLPKPDGYTWSPGQATEVAIDREGWREEKRPFTFVNDPDGDTIEFVIKSYPDHDGVTKRIADLSAGDDALLIDDPWGAITDAGPGVFIAGGTGITPMLGLLRARARGEGQGQPGLEGCTLIFANETKADIILHDELAAMDGLKTVFPLSQEKAEGHPHGRIDGAMLDAQVDDFSQVFYVCGPPPMEEAVTALLKERDVPDERIVTEA